MSEAHFRFYWPSKQLRVDRSSSKKDRPHLQEMLSPCHAEYGYVHVLYTPQFLSHGPTRIWGYSDQPGVRLFVEESLFTP